MCCVLTIVVGTIFGCGFGVSFRFGGRSFGSLLLETSATQIEHSSVYICTRSTKRGCESDAIEHGFEKAVGFQEMRAQKEEKSRNSQSIRLVVIGCCWLLKERRAPVNASPRCQTHTCTWFLLMALFARRHLVALCVSSSQMARFASGVSQHTTSRVIGARWARRRASVMPAAGCTA